MLRFLLLLVIPLSFLTAQEEGAQGSLSLEDGYVLIAPLGSGEAHLVSAGKEIVHTWDCGEGPGNATYLEPSGTLLRTAKVEDNPHFKARGGGGGQIRRFSWDGELLWDFRLSDDRLHHHHDVEPMPNGNVLVIAWERHTKEEAIAAGRDPSTIQSDAIWSETILELKPVGKDDAEVVWKWRLWDHLVQDFDESKENFGDPAKDASRIDLNFGIRRGGADWIHMNGIDYNAELDQIVLSARWFNEGWVIDHSTTTEEAATADGGKSGKGGRILYRLGNPAAYRAGDAEDRKFWQQHDIRWIPEGAPGAGRFLVFNNGAAEADRNFSSVDEFAAPVDADGNYPPIGTTSAGPADYTWSFSDLEHFLSDRISGAQRLPNGNTLICSGSQAWVFEVTPEGERIWDLFVDDFLGTQRGNCFRAPWYAHDYSPRFEELKE